MKSFDLKEGSTVMLIGTPEELQAKMDLSKKAIFAEDLTAEDKARLYQQKTGVYFAFPKPKGNNPSGINKPWKYLLLELNNSMPEKSQGISRGSKKFQRNFQSAK